MGEYNVFSGQRAFEFNLRKNFNYPAHFERGAELLYVLDGEIKITIEDHTALLRKGSLALIFPNQMHHYISDADNYVFYMVFSPEMILYYNKTISRKEPASPFLSPEQVHPDILYIIRSLIPEEILAGQLPFSYKPDMGASSPGVTYKNIHFDPGLMIGYLHIICSRIFPCLSLTDAQFEDRGQIIQKALTYIHNHYTESITRDHVARAVGTSRYYLSRIFTNKLNTNFNTYVNTLRIIQAKKLLEGGSSITEACFQSGFDSQSTFYRVFKEISGTTPKKYLEQL